MQTDLICHSQLQRAIYTRQDRRFNLTWKHEGSTLQKMSRWCDAVVSGSKVYFRPGEMYSKNIFVYQTTDSSWFEFHNSPHTNCALAIVNSDVLTTVGGGGFPYTSKLYSFTREQGKCGLWTEQFPTMQTKRRWTAVLNTGIDLVVAGGWGSANVPLATVEVMNIVTRKWSSAASLPEPLYHASVTLCGDYVYILGGYDVTKKPTRTVYTCSLSALLQSATLTQTSRLTGALSTSTITVWNRAGDLPVTESTCVSLHAQLLAIGGRDSDLKSTTAVYMYNLITKDWEIITHMLIPRHLCFAAVIPDNRVMVVGGETNNADNDSVEIATSSISFVPT